MRIKLFNEFMYRCLQNVLSHNVKATCYLNSTDYWRVGISSTIDGATFKIDVPRDSNWTDRRSFQNIQDDIIGISIDGYPIYRAWENGIDRTTILSADACLRYEINDRKGYIYPSPCMIRDFTNYTRYDINTFYMNNETTVIGVLLDGNYLLSPTYNQTILDSLDECNGGSWNGTYAYYSSTTVRCHDIMFTQ